MTVNKKRYNIDKNIEVMNIPKNIMLNNSVVFPLGHPQNTKRAAFLSSDGVWLELFLEDSTLEHTKSTETEPAPGVAASCTNCLDKFW